MTQRNQEDTLQHLTNTLDGYVRATTPEERALFLRASLVVCLTLGERLTRALRLVVTAMTREVTP